MAGAVWVQSCNEADFDVSTQTCSAPVWEARDTYPTLTIEDAGLLSAQIALVLVTAWGFKKLRQVIEQ